MPDDRVVDWLTSGRVPEQHSFALVGDSDCRNILPVDTPLTQDGACGAELGLEDLFRIVLDVTGHREDLIELTLGTYLRPSVQREEDCTARGSALV